MTDGGRMKTVKNSSGEPITINLDKPTFEEFCYLMVERGRMTMQQADMLKRMKHCE